jgi:hypothetical protein
MPSWLMSLTDSRLGSTRLQLAIQAGRASKRVPTTWVKIWYLISTASAGAVM